MTIVNSPCPKSLIRAALKVAVQAAVLAIVLAFGSTSVHAQQAKNPEDAVRIAQAKHGGGKVLGVRRKARNDGSAYFEVKLLTNGEVSIYKIDTR